MAASSERQPWFIEEIPATEDDDGFDGVICGSPLVSEGKGAHTAAEAFVSLDMGATTMLETQQCEEGKPSNGSSGTSSTGPLGGAWVCKAVAASASAHPPSSRGGCTWTKVGSRFLLFGGADAYQRHFADIHCFDTQSGKWNKVQVCGTPPSPRSGHSAVVLGESLVVYGGMNGQDCVTFNDLFELQPTSGSAECMEWIALSCANIPPRNSHAAVLDGETMIIIGGASPDGQTDEVFTIDLSARSNLSCRRVSCQQFEAKYVEGSNSGSMGGVPAAREMHSACARESRGPEGARAPTIFLMGGRSATGVLRDLYSLDTGSWTWKRLKDAPVARCAHSACLLETAGVMAIYGGWDGYTTVADDLHLFDVRLEVWTTPSISPQPLGRFAHAACAGQGGNTLLVFGGINPGEDLDDVVELIPGARCC